MDHGQNARAKRPILQAFLLAGLVGALAFSLAAQTSPPTDAGTQGALKFARIYGLLQENYADRINPDHAIFDGAIRGMLSQLDPFSAFFDRQQFELLQQQTRGEALGFGSILYVQPGKVLVLQTAQGSPSWRAGLGPGDQILKVNGERVDSLDFQALIRLLSQARSHPARLEVLHPGKLVPQDVDLTPVEVTMPTVDNAFVFPSRQIAYIHLSGFDKKTVEEVEDAMERLGGPKLKGLLLDLRNNHGGLVDSAVGVASLFLKPGSSVLTIRGRAEPEKRYQTIAMKDYFNLPMVVLVNGETASAAEVLSAALEEHDRAVLAGEPTFGKGVVESIFPLSDKTGLALLVAQYFTPSGRSIQRPIPGTALATNDPGLTKTSHFHTDDGRPVAAGGGITPDVVIPPHQLDPWVEFLNQGGRFTDFASQYLTYHNNVGKSFEVNSRVLSDFHNFLIDQGIRVPLEYWAMDQDYIKLRIKTEVFNLLYGLAAGNQVQTEGDPQVQKALTLFPSIPEILKGPHTPGATHASRVARLPRSHTSNQKG
ncbi:MAG: S41 family peptidase [Acidobacteria bacterium]|nr:S41 family peptidase [Acidobacteriota bacterium]